MKLTEICVKHPVFTVMLIAFLVGIALGQVLTAGSQLIFSPEPIPQP